MTEDTVEYPRSLANGEDNKCKKPNWALSYRVLLYSMFSLILLGSPLKAYPFEGIQLMFDCKQFRQYVVRPALEDIGLWSQEAEDLLVGTAAVESKLGTYLHQVGGGPAMGVFQMEPATHDDIWNNYLAYKDWKWNLTKITNSYGAEDMIYNLRYAAAMARIHYRRVPEPLPNRHTFASKASYIVALGAYWKEHYNTHLGAGTVEKFVQAYHDCGCA